MKPAPAFDYPEPNIFICSTLFSGGGIKNYTILLDGEFYVVNKYLLAALKDGMTPEELDMEPADRDEEDDDV